MEIIADFDGYCELGNVLASCYSWILKTKIKWYIILAR